MIYNNFNLQETIWSRIQKIIEKQKLPNAFLFHGNDGTGKEGIAIELAATLNCESLELEACGKCKSCKKIISFQNGNVKLIIPFPRGKITSKEDPSLRALSDNDILELEKMQREKGKDPFYNIAFSKANTILINSIRELKSNIFLSSIDKGYTVILIFNAEKLCQPQAQSGNALLKLLEEPPLKTIFILVTSFYSSILPTIKSRCQKIYFPNIQTNDILKFNKNLGVSNEKSNLIANIASGNIKIAIELSKNIDHLFSNLKIAIKCFFDPSVNNFQEFINNMNRLKRNNKIDLKYYYRTIILYFRDLMVYQTINNQNELIFSNLENHYLKITTTYNNVQWNDCINISENIYYDIERNGYIPLQSVRLLIVIQDIIKKNTV